MRPTFETSWVVEPFEYSARKPLQATHTVSRGRGDAADPPQWIARTHATLSTVASARLSVRAQITGECHIARLSRFPAQDGASPCR